MKVTERDWHMDRLEAIHFGFHFVAPVLLVIAGVLLVSAVLDATPARCDLGKGDLLPAWPIVIAGIVALILGREVSQWSQPRTYATRKNWTRAIGYGGWFWLFVLLAAVWLYEAMGTAHVATGAVGSAVYEPITYYVRCAAYQDIASNGYGLWTIFVVAVVSAIVGHWLWASHPPGGRRSVRSSGAK